MYCIVPYIHDGQEIITLNRKAEASCIAPYGLDCPRLR